MGHIGELDANPYGHCDSPLFGFLTPAHNGR
jgi:hypothetical protein